LWFTINSKRTFVVATGLWPVHLDAAVHIRKKTARRAVPTVAASF